MPKAGSRDSSLDASRSLAECNVELLIGNTHLFHPGRFEAADGPRLADSAARIASAIRKDQRWNRMS